MIFTTQNFRSITVFILVLIALSTGIAYSIFILMGDWLSELPWFFQIVFSLPSVPAVYAILFFFFNEYLWKLKIFRVLGIIEAENLNGRWKGIMKSSWDQFKTEMPVELMISQTATSITIRGKFNQSRSISMHEYVGKHPTHGTVLYHFYKNDPSYDAVKTMASHEGSSILIYDPDTKDLSGYYYSGRDRNNYGTINIRRDP